MLLFAGLGNPGPKYENNRHNIGFRAVDEIASLHGFGPELKRFHGLVREGRIGNQKILLLKPQTFMNESGVSVSEAANFYKLGPNEVYVFYDEIDLAPAKVKVKAGGGAAGHNGIRSIMSHYGKDFMRVRLGVGHPGNKAKVAGFVLKDFSKEDEKWVGPLLDEVARAVPMLVEERDSEFMNRIARAMQDAGFGPKPKKPAKQDGEEKKDSPDGV